MKIECISHACFKVELAGKIIYFDPYEIPPNSEKADIICASHDHYDHYDEKSAINVRKDSTVILCPSSCSKIVSSGAKGLKPGESLEIGGLTIKAVESYTPNKNFHPKHNNWLGFIVSDGNLKIYHAGDTDVIPEMSHFTGIDYSIIPVGGTYTMDQAEGVECVKIMEPKYVIPMHAWSEDNLNKFIGLLEKENIDVGIIKLSKGEVFSN
jgi:L-ascorbate metabolism protein UlaG (beta-lactamase superfamily)